MRFNCFLLVILISLIPFFGNTQNEDINKIWGTYITMSNSSEYSTGFVSDKKGNIYYISQSDSFYKFSSEGHLIWSKSVPNSKFYAIEVDYQNNVYLSGFTKSFSGISTPNTFQPATGDTMKGNDFILKYNSEGTKIWGTYFGNKNEANIYDDGSGYYFSQGLDTHYYSDLKITPNGNIIFLSLLKSKDMGTPGVFQSEQNNVKYTISEFDADGNRIWTTYYGITDYSPEFPERNRFSINGLQVDETGIYVLGNVDIHYMNDLDYFDSSGGYIYQGNDNILFLSKFNYNGQREWSKYIDGNDKDYLYRNSLAIDSTGLYIAISTSSDNWGGGGSYREEKGAQEAGALLKLDKDGNLLWSTYLEDIYFFVGMNAPSVYTNKGKVYIIGSTKVFSDGELQNYLNDNLNSLDTYVIKFNPDGSVIWADYCGGGNYDEALLYNLAFYENYFYISTNTESTSGIATEGAYIEDYNPSVYNYALSKYEDLENSTLNITEFNTINNSVLIYPNPASNYININFDSASDIIPCRATLSDVNGRVIKEIALNQHNNQVYINNLSEGIYFLNMNSFQHEFRNMKIIISK